MSESDALRPLDCVAHFSAICQTRGSLGNKIRTAWLCSMARTVRPGPSSVAASTRNGTKKFDSQFMKIPKLSTSQMMEHPRLYHPKPVAVLRKFKEEKGW